MRTALFWLAAALLQAQDGRKPLTLEQIHKMTPAGVKVLPDVAYREGSAAWRMDIALPEAESKEPRPAVLMIQGSADPTISPDDSRELFQALKAAGAKDVTLMMIQDAGHNVFAAHAPETEAAMRAFFERTLRKGLGLRQ